MQVPATITSSAERLRQHGLRIFCAFLTALCAGEGTRMLLQNQATDARWGGWYLLVVGLLISFGIFARDTDETEQSSSSAQSAAAAEPRDDQMTLRTATTEQPDVRADVKLDDAAGPTVGPAVDPAAGSVANTGRDEKPVRQRTRQAAIFFAAALVYAWALPWVGFAIANALFIAGYLLIIDKQRWFLAIGIAVVTDVVLVIGMGLLGVFLPTGVYGLSF